MIIFWLWAYGQVFFLKLCLRSRYFHKYWALICFVGSERRGLSWNFWSLAFSFLALILNLPIKLWVQLHSWEHLNYATCLSRFSVKTMHFERYEQQMSLFGSWIFNNSQQAITPLSSNWEKSISIIITFYIQLCLCLGSEDYFLLKI